MKKRIVLLLSVALVVVVTAMSTATAFGQAGGVIAKAPCPTTDPVTGETITCADFGKSNAGGGKVAPPPAPTAVCTVIEPPHPQCMLLSREDLLRKL